MGPLTHQNTSHLGNGRGLKGLFKAQEECTKKSGRRLININLSWSKVSVVFSRPQIKHIQFCICNQCLFQSFVKRQQGVTQGNDGVRLIIGGTRWVSWPKYFCFKIPRGSTWIMKIKQLKSPNNLVAYSQCDIWVKSHVN